MGIVDVSGQCDVLGDTCSKLGHTKQEGLT